MAMGSASMAPCGIPGEAAILKSEQLLGGVAMVYQKVFRLIAGSIAEVTQYLTGTMAVIIKQSIMGTLKFVLELSVTVYGG